MIKIIFVSLIIIIVQVVSTAKLPSDLKRCKKNDKPCLRTAIQDAIPKFAKGYKSLGVLGTDPLLIPEMKVPGGTGSVSINQVITDAQFIGLSSAVFKEIDFDVEAKVIKWKWYCPKLILKGKYEMTGQIMVFPVKGKGNLLVELENVTTSEEIKFDYAKRNGEEYFQFGNSAFDMNVADVHFLFENVFDGNKEMTDNINKVLNENSKVIFDEIKGSYNGGIKQFVDNIINRFFQQVPVSEVFLD